MIAFLAVFTVSGPTSNMRLRSKYTLYSDFKGSPDNVRGILGSLAELGDQACGSNADGMTNAELLNENSELSGQTIANSWGSKKPNVGHIHIL